jgi:hypothetical protein
MSVAEFAGCGCDKTFHLRDAEESGAIFCELADHTEADTKDFVQLENNIQPFQEPP